MVNVITASTSGARNIHVMIEFLLIILTDVPKDFIHHDQLFDLLARVGALTRKVSIVVHDLEDKLLNKESTDETNRATLDLLENIKLLKEDLKHVYLKAPDTSQCRFPMSDGPLFMRLLHRHLNDLLYSNAYSIALIKEEIGWVKEDLEFIRSFFMKVEQELYKDLWTRVLDVAYEAKDVIDSIIVRDNGLLHLIFSLPITINKIKLIKEVSSVGTNQLWDFRFLSSLKLLCLWQFPLTSDALSTIARLPKLEVLSLVYSMIQGEEWNMGEEDTFENLKCLKLHGVILAKWEVGESFTMLGKLELLACHKLEEIPPSFGDIGSLKIIQLWESPQLEDSAMKIKQYAEDIRGGDELQVLGPNNIPLFK